MIFHGLLAFCDALGWLSWAGTHWEQNDHKAVEKGSRADFTFALSIAIPNLFLLSLYIFRLQLLPVCGKMWVSVEYTRIIIRVN